MRSVAWPAWWLAVAFSFGASDAQGAPQPAPSAALDASCRAPSDDEATLPRGCYLDRAGRKRDPAVEYDARLDSLDADPLRALIEETLLLGIGVLWYWLDRNRNLADWDYPSWKQRFTLEAWRYDNNEFPINFIAHPLNGAAFYAFPRANEHGPYVSLVYSFTTSFIWEFLLEFREKVSINDVLVTPLSGMPIGEFAAKLWRYVNALPAKPSAGHQVAAALLGFPSWVHAQMDDPPPLDGPLDHLGLSAAMAHRFEAGYALRLHSDGTEVATHGIRLAGRLSTIAGEGRPGRYGLFFHDADVASFRLDAGLGAGAREVDLESETVLLGYHHQSIDRRGDGHRLLVGVPLAVDYRFLDLPGLNERLGLLHLPGLGADATITMGSAAVTGRARLAADFAGIGSPAYNPWVRATLGPADRPKSILRKHGYYYGWGLSSALGLGLRVGPFDATADGWLGAYSSHDGLDRTQEELTHDPSSSDRLLELETSLGVTLPDAPLRLGLGAFWSNRRSRVEQLEVTRERQVWTLSLATLL